MLKELVLEYFDSFGKKNISLIEFMFSEDITLRDWEINVVGKCDVLNATQNIFNSVDAIEVTPLHVYCEENTVIADLKIVINGTDVLSVVDIIEFDDDRKIIGIRAYKQ